MGFESFLELAKFVIYIVMVEIYVEIYIMYGCNLNFMWMEPSQDSF